MAIALPLYLFNIILANQWTIGRNKRNILIQRLTWVDSWPSNCLQMTLQCRLVANRLPASSRTSEHFSAVSIFPHDFPFFVALAMQFLSAQGEAQKGAVAELYLRSQYFDSLLHNSRNAAVCQR